MPQRLSYYVGLEAPVEYLALYYDGRVLRPFHCYARGLPLRDTIQKVANGLGLGPACETTFRTTVWEDNDGCLHLANMDPGQHTARSKFYDCKVHWFRSFLKDPDNRTAVQRIETAEQLADLFTKPLAREPFERLRKKLLQW